MVDGARPMTTDQVLDEPTQPVRRRKREAEAMPAGTLRELLRMHIESLLPTDALEVAKVAEQSEREHIERMAALLDGDAA